MSSRRKAPPQREWETVAHAAERTDYGVDTLRDLIDRGVLPAYRLSDKPNAALRVKVSEVNALMRPVRPTQVEGGAA